MDLNKLLIFAKIVQHKSFTKAAEHLGMDKSTISTKLSQLEANLGVRLLNRSTRSVNLTEAGAKYYEYCRQAVEIAEEAESFSSSLGDEAVGLLRISASNNFSKVIIESAIKPFMDANPKVEVELIIEYRAADLIQENIDIAIRVGIGPLEDSSLIAQKVLTGGIGIYCAPSYIKKHGEIKSIDELNKSKIVEFTVPAGPQITISKDGISHKVIAKNKDFKTNDLPTVKQASIAGLGVCILPKHSAKEALKSNELVEIFSDWEIEPLTVYAVYASREWMPEKLRVFLKYLKELDQNLLK
ncbi:LysR family transcriptional regulator [Candidatus Thioglobus sp.]|jgi:DNA-binding transcriptional LysR family regulator|nr:LysR family transcriptional regulator [Candidatus Thioglobus sp.]